MANGDGRTCCGLCVGDFDGDDRSDILWRNISNGVVYIWFVHGIQLVDAGPAGGVPLEWQIAGVGDFDGDDRSDILWRNTSNGVAFIWLMDGTTRIGQGAPGIAGLEWQIAGVGDFDGEKMGVILRSD